MTVIAEFANEWLVDPNPGLASRDESLPTMTTPTVATIVICTPEAVAFLATVSLVSKTVNN